MSDGLLYTITDYVLLVQPRRCLGQGSAVHLPLSRPSSPRLGCHCSLRHMMSLILILPPLLLGAGLTLDPCDPAGCKGASVCPAPLLDSCR